jgi:carbamoyltransferase
VKVLGVNAVFHDPAAALVVDGEIVAAAEEERFSRRKHGKRPVPFSTWELPEASVRWCLAEAAIEPGELDAVGYSYDPALALGAPDADLTADAWEPLRTLYARRAPRFLATAFPGLRAERVRFVGHHEAHAASAYLASGADSCATLVVDGRGERASHLAGHWHDGHHEVLAAQDLPDSLGLLYEELTAHLGFARSSDEYKVMAMASYGRPAYLGVLRARAGATGAGGFRAEPRLPVTLTPPVDDGAWQPLHADLACSIQRLVEETLLELCDWLHERTGETRLAMAGGVALNCVANSRLWREGPFDDIWVQPAAGDAGTALGAALHVAHALGDRPRPMATTALGRRATAGEVEAALRRAAVPYERPDDLPGAVADVLAADGLVAWVQGRSEFGPRALGHRSLLADPRSMANTERLNDVKGREQFRPVAPMVAAGRAAELFTEGPLPSPFMLFTHRVRPGWRERIPAVIHVDGTARVQTVDPGDDPLVAALLDAFCERTGVPVLVNTSLNTAGRPIVDDVRDALECFGSAPIDALAVGPFLVRRPGSAAAAAASAGGAAEVRV